MQQRRRIVTLAVAGAVATGLTGHAAIAGTPEAQKWVDSEFQPSTLSKQQQMDEMKWFILTSGGFGPSVGGPIAMGFVARAYSMVGTPICVIVRGKPLSARVVALPFYPHAYYRG